MDNQQTSYIYYIGNARNYNLNLKNFFKIYKFYNDYTLALHSLYDSMDDFRADLNKYKKILNKAQGSVCRQYRVDRYLSKKNKDGSTRKIPANATFGVDINGDKIFSFNTRQPQNIIHRENAYNNFTDLPYTASSYLTAISKIISCIENNPNTPYNEILLKLKKLPLDILMNPDWLFDMYITNGIPEFTKANNNPIFNRESNHNNYVFNFFIDVDFTKEEYKHNNEYFSQLAYRISNAFHKFHLYPSIAPSANGMHINFCTVKYEKDSTKLEQWYKSLQYKLCQLINIYTDGVDTVVGQTNRLHSVFFTLKRDKNTNDIYMFRPYCIGEFHEVTHFEKYINNMFNKASKYNKITPFERNMKTNTKSVTIPATTNKEPLTNIIKYLPSVNVQPQTLTNQKDAIKFINDIMFNALDIKTQQALNNNQTNITTNSIFREDKHPSLVVTKMYSETFHCNYYRFFDYACQNTMSEENNLSIIGHICNAQGLDIKGAIKYILNYYNCTYNDNIYTEYIQPHLQLSYKLSELLPSDDDKKVFAFISFVEHVKIMQLAKKHQKRGIINENDWTTILAQPILLTDIPILLEQYKDKFKLSEKAQKRILKMSRQTLSNHMHLYHLTGYTQIILENKYHIKFRDIATNEIQLCNVISYNNVSNHTLKKNIIALEIINKQFLSNNPKAKNMYTLVRNQHVISNAFYNQLNKHIDSSTNKTATETHYTIKYNHKSDNTSNIDIAQNIPNDSFVPISNKEFIPNDIKYAISVKEKPKLENISQNTQYILS